MNTGQLMIVNLNMYSINYAKEDKNMKEFRFVVNGKASAWRSIKNMTVALMNYFADSFNEYFEDWYIEYR